MRRKIKEPIIIFTCGGAIYCIIEILFRGYTHWSMFIAGGLCLFILYNLYGAIEADSGQRCSLWHKCALGTLVITAVELTSGIFVNILFGLSVWDYSAVPFNYLGQICPAFAALWFFLCIPVIFLCDFFNAIFHRRENV